MSLDDSYRPVEHYECLYIIFKFANAPLSIYLAIPPTLPQLTWVTNNCHINRKVVLFPILNDGP